MLSTQLTALAGSASQRSGEFNTFRSVAQVLPYA